MVELRKFANQPLRRPIARGLLRIASLLQQGVNRIRIEALRMLQMRQEVPVHFTTTGAIEKCIFDQIMNRFVTVAHTER